MDRMHPKPKRNIKGQSVFPLLVVILVLAVSTAGCSTFNLQPDNAIKEGLLRARDLGDPKNLIGKDLRQVEAELKKLGYQDGDGDFKVMKKGNTYMLFGMYGTGAGYLKFLETFPKDEQLENKYKSVSKSGPVGDPATLYYGESIFDYITEAGWRHLNAYESNGHVFYRESNKMTQVIFVETSAGRVRTSESFQCSCPQYLTNAQRESADEARRKWQAN